MRAHVADDVGHAERERGQYEQQPLKVEPEERADRKQTPDHTRRKQAHLGEREARDSQRG